MCERDDAMKRGRGLVRCPGPCLIAMSSLMACGDDFTAGGDSASEERTSSPTQIVARNPSTGSGGATEGGERITSGGGSNPSPTTNASSSGGWGNSSGVVDMRGETSGGNGEVYPPEDMHISMSRGCDEQGVWRTQFLLTGTPGRLSCLAVEDTDVIPAGAGFQYWVVFEEQSSGEPQLSGPGCPVGEYLLEHSFSCQSLFGADVPRELYYFSGCGVYRQWDSHGVFDRVEPIARSGLVTIDLVEGTGCVIDVELHFKDRTSLIATHVIEEVGESASCSQSF